MLQHLENLSQKTTVTDDEIVQLKHHMEVERSTLKALLKDIKFCDTLTSIHTTFKVSHSDIPLSLGFLLFAFQGDDACFKQAMKHAGLKNLFIKEANKIRKATYENPFFGGVLTGKLAFENLQVITEDPELKTSFCKSRHAGRDLIEFAEKHPQYINYIITHPELKIAITKDRRHHRAIRDILYCSRDKKDADIVFQDETFGGWDDKLKDHIYNTIAQNYRNSLPDSLVKRCLFAIAKAPEEALAKKAQKAPGQDLEKAIYNFSIQTN
jgi:hypothetical protein